MNILPWAPHNVIYYNICLIVWYVFFWLFLKVTPYNEIDFSINDGTDPNGLFLITKIGSNQARITTRSRLNITTETQYVVGWQSHW